MAHGNRHDPNLHLGPLRKSVDYCGGLQVAHAAQPLLYPDDSARGRRPGDESLPRLGECECERLRQRCAVLQDTSFGHYLSISPLYSRSAKTLYVYFMIQIGVLTFPRFLYMTNALCFLLSAPWLFFLHLESLLIWIVGLDRCASVSSSSYCSRSVSF